MHPIIARTFGGLSASYYIRQLLFGLTFTGVFVWASRQNGQNLAPTRLYVVSAVNALLYPYSRFVYETVVGYIMGRTVFVVRGVIFLVAKLLTMVMCWCLAILVAPIGLLFLYFYHGSRGRAG